MYQTLIEYLLCAELTGKDGDRFRVAHFKALRKIDTYIDRHTDVEMLFDYMVFNLIPLYYFVIYVMEILSGLAQTLKVLHGRMSSI